MTEALVLTVITAATPLLLAALGELVVERAGVLNLGVEGMMIVGAVAAFAAAGSTGNSYIGVLAGAGAGATLALLFAALAVWVVTNQIATGLALTIFGLGIAGLVGEGFVGQPGVRLAAIDVPILSDLPFIGRVLFRQDALFYVSIGLAIGVSWFLFRSRAGLRLRSVGDDPAAAHAIGLHVTRIRTLAVLFGGACAGLGGAQLTLVYTPQWIEGVTAGRGWIALALVVFATWRPLRVVAGAYLFGAVTIAQFHAQALGVDVPSQLLAAMPYIVTIIVLVVIAGSRRLTIVNTPKSLGMPFVPPR